MRKAIGWMLLVLTLPASAEVYRYVDEKGVVHYSDQPPTRDAKPVQLPPLQTYKPGQGPPPEIFAADKSPPAKAKAPPARFSISISSPTPGETIRASGDELSVSVKVMPGLASGFGLVYYLDGAAYNAEPLMQPSLALRGVYRGEHQLQVALIDPDGREVARSPSVTVFMKQPTAAPAAPPSK